MAISTPYFLPSSKLPFSRTTCCILWVGVFVSPISLPPSPTRSESRVPFFPHSRTIIRLPFRLFPLPLVTPGQGEALEEERSLEDFWPEVAR